MKQLLIIASLFILGQCAPKEEQLSIPAGMAVETVVTSALDYNNKPVNDVAHFPSFMEGFAIYNNFLGLSDGEHSYTVVIVTANGFINCDYPPTKFVSQGGTHTMWMKILGGGCMPVEGEYLLKVYLDGNWVAAKTVWKLSEEETKSGKFEPWWDKGKYMELFPAAGSGGEEWKVKMVSEFEGDVTNLFVTAHEGFNRIFYLERNRETENIDLKEYREDGTLTLFKFPSGSNKEPKTIRFLASAGKLYFYNKYIQGSYDLKIASKNENDPLPFPPAGDNSFESPGHDHKLTTNGILDGKPLVSPEQYCGDPTVMWASWDKTGQRLFYWIECGQGSDYGFFVRDLVRGKSKRLLDGINEFRYPVYFENNGTDFVAYIEQVEGGNAVLKIATQANYPAESGFGPNFTWGRALTVSGSLEDGNGAALNADFYSPPQDYLSFDYSDDNDGMAGEIKKIGRIKDGEWAGLELYRLRDWGTMGDIGDKSEVAYRPIEYTYLIRDENELIVINARNGGARDFRIVDLDGKRMKSGLFNGAKTARIYSNLFVAGLHSPPLVNLPGSDVKLKRRGVYNQVAEHVKLFDHATEGEIHVSQPDDGSFWRFNGDGTVTLFELQYDFKSITGSSTTLSLDDFVPYTNRNCQGNALDMAHILTLDPGRLRQIGTTDANAPIYDYASAQDEGLIAEYNDLTTAYRSENEFTSIDEFVKGVPLFLWKDPFSRYVRWIRKEYLAPSNCEPILYLYPETTTEVVVELGEKVNVFNSRPHYGSNWQLTASSDGTLIDQSTSKSYHHIFWEGISGHLPPLEKGFVVDTANLRAFFNETLACLGLNSNEARDFQDAWLKEFKGARYYFIGFYDRETIDWYAPMQITPPPATIIRILMDYRPLAGPVYIESPVFAPRPGRSGFVAVEWAGLKRVSGL